MELEEKGSSGPGVLEKSYSLTKRNLQEESFPLAIGHCSVRTCWPEPEQPRCNWERTHRGAKPTR